MKVIAAVLVSTMVMAGGAWATDTHAFAGPSTAQFNALKAQVAALQKKEATLTDATGIALLYEKQLQTFDKQCLAAWKSIKEYSGYSIVFSDNSTGTTTALDWTANGDTPDGYLPLASSDCTNKAP